MTDAADRGLDDVDGALDHSFCVQQPHLLPSQYLSVPPGHCIFAVPVLTSLCPGAGCSDWDTGFVGADSAAMALAMPMNAIETATKMDFTVMRYIVAGLPKPVRLYRLLTLCPLQRG